MKRRVKWIGLSLILGFLLVGPLGGPALAQSAGGAMKGIQAVKFFVTDFSQNSLDCRITKAGLQEAFSQPLRQGGPQMGSSGAYTVYVRATTVVTEDGFCISNIDAWLEVNTRYFNQATASERTGRVRLWSDGGLFYSDLEEHAVILNSAFRRMGRNFVAEWQRDQQ